jgi:hypothetical protein
MPELSPVADGRPRLPSRGADDRRSVDKLALAEARLNAELAQVVVASRLVNLGRAKGFHGRGGASGQIRDERH